MISCESRENLLKALSDPKTLNSIAEDAFHVADKDSNGYMLDKTSSSYPKPLALSKIDEGNLNTIANKLGIDYIHMMNTSSIEHKLIEISAKTVKSDPTEEETYRDIYYVFAIMLLIVLGYEFIYIRRRVL